MTQEHEKQMPQEWSCWGVTINPRPGETEHEAKARILQRLRELGLKGQFKQSDLD